jgi:hypothetical protein
MVFAIFHPTSITVRRSALKAMEEKKLFMRFYGKNRIKTDVRQRWNGFSPIEI